MEKSRKELLEAEYRSDPVTTEQLSTVTTTELKSIGSTEQLSVEDKIDRALVDTADLINQTFKPWYAKQAYRLGVDRYIGLAKEARMVRSGSPQKVFSSSLKRA